ncbi:hypothetical protein CWE12_12915 [Aliidiomarina sedimenti]|uniref:Uncharacterized protein n=1 Tax=Aliidiomarina sedimenti TaxID=1933879 RepID=A0ABY0BV32_9GAMM|nr:hypothetical protein [Aliidiomarina sedimenti]RUO28116.1 hypothetical protein CWE12_12915 [Aliidiomarina sedimenti]
MTSKRYTWKAFWLRNLKAYMPFTFMFLGMWNGVELGNFLKEYIEWWSMEGSGPPQQRWYRVLASFFLFLMLFGSFIDAISTWHYLKNPDEIPKEDDEVK